MSYKTAAGVPSLKNTFLNQCFNTADPAIHSPAKRHEFTLYIPPALHLLESMEAREIVDFQADEGVMSLAFCKAGADNHAVFVLPPAEADPDGLYGAMADHVTTDMRDEGRLRIVATTAEIADSSADAILFNNILGCLGSLENVEIAITEAERVLKPGGHAIVTTPNPQGGFFSSYRCMNVPERDDHGATYDFQMRGEDAVFVNLHLSKRGLAETFRHHGFGDPLKVIVPDSPYEDLVNSERPAFFQYVFQKIPEPA